MPRLSLPPGPTFRGFASPTANVTWTPNQFFDVCMRHNPLVVIRLVGFMIRKTQGWCDRHGNPQQETIRVSLSDLTRHAGISRSMIGKAVAMAIDGHFLRRVTDARASASGQSSVSAEFELCWDERSDYQKDPAKFRGFFAGDGNRTFIPNAYFDNLLPCETLGVVRVVGSIIRFSIGFVSKHGLRRQETALSYSDIHRYAKISNPNTLSASLRLAVASNYIERVESGIFDPNAGRASRPSVYRLKWLSQAAEAITSTKTVAGTVSRNRRSEIRSGTSSISVAADQIDNRSGIQSSNTKKTNKQDEQFAVTFERLKKEGFDQTAAEAIAARWSFDCVERQINWLPLRHPSTNRLGMLRKAIEQDWAAPSTRTKRVELRESSLDGRSSVRSFRELAFERFGKSGKPDSAAQQVTPTTP